jgi:hypothetical protein
MPLTISTSVNAIPANDRSADRLRKTYTITGPTSYTTGGVSFTPQDLGFGSRIHVMAGTVMHAVTTGTSCRIIALNNTDPAAPKMQWYDQAFNEIANGIDLSGYLGNVEFIGQ